MDVSKLNNKVVIIKDNFKDILLDLINKSNYLLNIKIITLNDLKKNYYFDYDNETIYYICNKYNVIDNIARIYLNNLYYLKEIDDEKINFLKELKSDLDSHGLLKYNKLFKSFLRDKEIVLIDLDYVDKFYLNIIDEIKEYNNISKYDFSLSESKKDLYEANDIEEEIEFVASLICKLIKNNVDIKNIKICNVCENYYYVIKKVFDIYKIPVNLKSFVNLNGTFIVKKFKELYSSDIKNTISELSKFVITSSDNDVYKEIVNIVNSYSFIDDYEKVKSFIFNDLNKVKTKNEILKNAVNIIDIDNIKYYQYDYVFVLNYNEGIIPINYKDEDYLSDEVKYKLKISTSFDLNYKSNKK